MQKLKQQILIKNMIGNVAENL